MMRVSKLIAASLFAASVALAGGAALAQDVGGTVTHGTTSVGKGASKIYHDMARGVHKTIAHNTHNPHTRASHVRRAAIHHQHAAQKTHESEHEMDKAKSDANK